METTVLFFSATGSGKGYELLENYRCIKNCLKMFSVESTVMCTLLATTISGCHDQTERIELTRILHRLDLLCTSNTNLFNRVSIGHKITGMPFLYVSSQPLALHPTQTLLNHDCNPNLYSYSLPNGSIVARVCKPVTAGEELCRSYFVSYQETLQVRQAYLLKFHGFECSCELCVSELQGF